MGEMHGARRVVTFCLLTAVLPTVLLVIPLYLRHSMYADVIYSVAESDVLEAVEGISTVFCQEQILRMNSTFHAFQLRQMPPLSHQKKHIQLKKSMILPDDTVEYWGFYLLAGSNISLLACSRYDGAGILVVKGEKNLKTCQSMETQYKNVKYQKGNKIKSNVGNSWETRTSQIKNEKIFSHVTPATEKRDLVNHTLKVTNDKNIENGENDALEELTRELKEFISNFPTNRDSLENSENESLEERQKTKNHTKPGSLPNLSHVRNTTKKNDQRISDVTNEEHDSKAMKHKRATNLLAKELQNLEINVDDDNDSLENIRPKRKTSRVDGHKWDAAVGHGGNANVTQIESSDSSFEDSLRTCYNDQQLFSKSLNASPYCYSNYSLSHHKVGTLHIESDGYYYFIFYSDNDFNDNPIHAHFDIYKMTYQHTNFTRGCVNQTECKFPITFWSSEIVIVEVPTHDGIEHEDGDASVLISSCYPRMSIYAIFPVAVLFLILGCAFL
ncbi:Uncharacterized protein GBIM_02764 [Gryllus bimaculatus]|nr:Uncharacterized protein GBIM_02764 [Gryllus bimaculatus]